MDFIHIALLTACVGHLICCYCDWQITYTPNGRFSFGDLKDNNRLSALFIHTSQKRFLRSILFGVLAMTLELFGYLALCAWMNQYSSRCALLMVISTGIAFISGVVHHVFCGTVEWFYLQFDCMQSMTQILPDTIPIAISC